VKELKSVDDRSGGKKSKLKRIAWSADEHLICVFENGVVQM
jgi:hypothetical protein